MNEKAESIFKHGTYSPYWEEFSRSLPWDKDSTETKLYLAGILSGLSHDCVLRILEEQSSHHGSGFVSLGFFYWKDFFSK